MKLTLILLMGLIVSSVQSQTMSVVHGKFLTCHNPAHHQTFVLMLDMAQQRELRDALEQKIPYETRTAILGTRGMNEREDSILTNVKLTASKEGNLTISSVILVGSIKLSMTLSESSEVNWKYHWSTIDEDQPEKPEVSGIETLNCDFKNGEQILKS